MTREQIFELLKREIAEVLPDVPKDQIRMDSTLQDLGANAIDRAEIVTQALHELKLSIPATQLAMAKDVGSLVNLFHESLRERRD